MRYIIVINAFLNCWRLLYDALEHSRAFFLRDCCTRRVEVSTFVRELFVLLILGGQYLFISILDFLHEGFAQSFEFLLNFFPIQLCRRK